MPYVWGGKSFAGLDCSGLVQTAMADTIWTPPAVAPNPVVMDNLQKVHGFYANSPFVHLEEDGDHGWYPDAQTVGDRFQLARDRGLGVGLWRLGTEDQRLWDDPRIAAG